MNERTKELAEQAALLGPTSRIGNAHEAAERFAELVRQDEREAMRVLLADQARSYQQANDFVSFLALSTLDMAIRARSQA